MLDHLLQTLRTRDLSDKRGNLTHLYWFADVLASLSTIISTGASAEALNNRLLICRPEEEEEEEEGEKASVLLKDRGGVKALTSRHCNWAWTSVTGMFFRGQAVQKLYCLLQRLFSVKQLFRIRAQFIVHETPKSCIPKGECFCSNVSQCLRPQGIVQAKMKILSSFPRPHVLPNLYDSWAPKKIYSLILHTKKINENSASFKKRTMKVP